MLYSYTDFETSMCCIHFLEENLPFVAFNWDSPLDNTVTLPANKEPLGIHCELFSLKQVHVETGIVMVQLGRSTQYSAHIKKCHTVPCLVQIPSVMFVMMQLVKKKIK